MGKSLSLEEEVRTFSISGTVVSQKNNKPLKMVEVFLFFANDVKTTITDKNGYYRFKGLDPGSYQLRFTLTHYRDHLKGVEISDADISVSAEMQALEHITSEVKIIGVKTSLNPGKGYMKPVEGTTITKDVKSEVTLVDNLIGGKGNGNSREVFGSITGINIWSEGNGLQLGIGGRGLSPNRTANFNTRQNGYDISADALGYPESYYSPPTEALDRIEIIRGAASIQYGPQFGGMVNFIMKEGNRDKPIAVNSRTTIGSFGLLNSFNSVGGTIGNWNYYTFYQRKIGNGWRPNSEFNVHTAYAALKYEKEDYYTIKLDYTFMSYLAQQAGGLTDAQFNADPRQSFRARNWFKVDWNMLALNTDFSLSKKTKLNWRSFGLMAARSALGNLGRIDRPDDDQNRDYIRGEFNNYGTEVRLLHQYKMFNVDNQAFLIGGRLYKGNTHGQQGEADATNLPNFEYEGGRPSLSDYVFPSFNASVFTSNIIYLSKKWSLTPGARLEYIHTSADGVYNEQVYHPLTNELLFAQEVTENKERNRSIGLYGLGVGYRASDYSTWYMNYTKNFKSINFSDMQIVNPNFKIDENLKDETGFNFEIGTRGQLGEYFGYDLSGFYLYYHDRIGAVLDKDPADGIVKRWRRNISDSRNVGIETYLEYDIWSCFFGKKEERGLVVFSNLALIDAKYVNSEEAAFQGKWVENVPKVNWKAGTHLTFKKFKFNTQYSFMSHQYTDATNAEESVASAIYGSIPQYSIFDLSMAYEAKEFLTFEAGMNNVLDAMYFTRRAVGYPGPGIIPADGRSIYLTVEFNL